MRQIGIGNAWDAGERTKTDGTGGKVGSETVTNIALLMLFTFDIPSNGALHNNLGPVEPPKYCEVCL